MPISDPTGSSALLTAVLWLEQTLLGTIATTIAIMAIAGIGFMMLSGHVDVRRGISIVIGCFIVFGAPVIAAGIMSVSGEPDGEFAPVVAAPPIEPSIQTVPSQPPPRYDPYAGASVPPS